MDQNTSLHNKRMEMGEDYVVMPVILEKHRVHSDQRFLNTGYGGKNFVGHQTSTVFEADTLSILSAINFQGWIMYTDDISFLQGRVEVAQYAHTVIV